MAIPRRKEIDWVSLVGLFIVFISTVKIASLAQNWSRYRFLLRPMPENIIWLRYAGSLGLRVLGVIAGIGILRRQEMCRRLMIGLSSLTIVALHWKHPFYSFRPAMAIAHGWMAPLAARLGEPLPSLEACVAGAWIPWMIVCSLDVALSSFLIFFFTRRDISKQFH